MIIDSESEPLHYEDLDSEFKFEGDSESDVVRNWRETFFSIEGSPEDERISSDHSLSQSEYSLESEDLGEIVSS